MGQVGQSPLLAVAGSRNQSGLKVDGILNQSDGLTISRMLLDAGANPNMQLFYRPAGARGGPLSRGTTPLIRAASNGDVELMKLLMQSGAQADLPQADLQTPVSVLAGARSNQELLVEGLAVLVEAGVDLNVRAVPHHLQRARGGTPLHYAVRSRNEQMAKALVEAGADIDGKDIDGLTALDYAESRGAITFTGTRQPPNTKMAELLRSLGASEELDITPFWPNVGPPFFYPWNIFPLDAEAERHALVPGSFDHQ